MQSLFYYYKDTLHPFRSIMELSEADMIEFMRVHLPNDSIFHKDPNGYIRRRRETETWLHETFRKMGGEPLISHPIYMTLGRSSYIESLGLYQGCVEVPLSLFSGKTISFTYPDSYVSRWLSETSNEYFDPIIHGRVFALADIPGLPGQGFDHNDAWKIEGRKFDFFVEAQIWDLEPLRGFLPAAV